MKICVKCIIPENFPGVHFDAQDVCNYCQKVEGAIEIDSSEELLSELLEEKRSDTYDCIVCYSGGKDSTFTLQTLVQDYGLKILAFTFDHGFTSIQALENIDRVTTALGIEKEIFRPDSEVVQKIFKTALQQLPDMPPESIYGRGMQEYGPVCYVCGSMIHSIAIRIALRYGTRLIGTGYTVSQDPAYYKGYVNYAQAIDTPSLMSAEPWLAISRIMYHFLRYWNIEELDELFLKHISEADVKKISFLRLFDFVQYDERKIYQRIAQLGWQKPLDTDSCSTNCLLNSLGIYVYRKTMGYHLYTKQLADLIRRGFLTRNEAMKAVQSDINMDLVRDIARKLDVKI